MGGPRYEGRGGYSPARDGRDRGPPPRYRSRSRDGRDQGQYDSGYSKVPVGRHKITVENIPEDMGWLELKDLGRDIGPSLTFARTFRLGRNGYCGMLEFRDRQDAEAVVRELDGRRVEGSQERLRASRGDLSAEVAKGGGGGKGGDYERRYDERDRIRHDDRGSAGGRFDDRGDRRRDERERERGRDDRDREQYDRRDDRRPPERERGRERWEDWDDQRGRRDDGYGDRRRSPPPKRARREDDEPLMTLFLTNLPQDAREEEVLDALESRGGKRVVMMNKGVETNAFLRFNSVREAEDSMNLINDGKIKVCRQDIRAEMARRNTSF